jgi:hypothetical protein
MSTYISKTSWRCCTVAVMQRSATRERSQQNRSIRSAEIEEKNTIAVPRIGNDMRDPHKLIRWSLTAPVVGSLQVLAPNRDEHVLSRHAQHDTGACVDA